MTDVIANPDVQALGKAVSRADQLLHVLEEAGLSPKALQGPIDDPTGRRELVIYWSNLFDPKPAEDNGQFYTLTEVAQLLGGDFHGPDQARKFFGGRMNQKCFQPSVVFDAEEVRAHKGTHVLVAAPRISVMGVHAKAAQFFLSKEDPWFGESNQRRAFTDAKIAEADWYWHTKEAVPSSTSVVWDQQLGMVWPPDFVPEANLSVYVYALHKLATGERLFRQLWVRVSSVSADGYRVGLHGYSDGLYVSRWSDDAGSDVGVAAARKAKWKLAA